MSNTRRTRWTSEQITAANALDALEEWHAEQEVAQLSAAATVFCQQMVFDMRDAGATPEHAARVIAHAQGLSLEEWRDILTLAGLLGE
jgi:hypothetical protein